jgi:K+-sensing histidine kinase KdpD
MSVKFCVVPANANLIAENLVGRAREAAKDMSRWIARLHVGRGQYRLDAMSLEDLRTTRRLLTEMGAEIDGVLSAHELSSALIAAE